ncbi:UNVERIFIED_CONTAM: hypothetical protein FKN15_077032 [Acipenser sinensis]
MQCMPWKVKQEEDHKQDPSGWLYQWRTPHTDGSVGWENEHVRWPWETMRRSVSSRIQGVVMYRELGGWSEAEKEPHCNNGKRCQTHVTRVTSPESSQGEKAQLHNCGGVSMSRPEVDDNDSRSQYLQPGPAVIVGRTAIGDFLHICVEGAPSMTLLDTDFSVTLVRPDVLQGNVSKTGGRDPNMGHGKVSDGSSNNLKNMAFSAHC